MASARRCSAFAPPLQRLARQGPRWFAVAFAGVLYAPLYAFGYRSNPLAAFLVLLAVLAAVWASLRVLNRRLVRLDGGK